MTIQVEHKCGHHGTPLKEPTNTILAEKYGWETLACESCFPELFTQEINTTSTLTFSTYLTSEQREDVIDAIEYIRGVFPIDAIFDKLVAGDAVEVDIHSISGDDLAGACHHLNRLMEIFGQEEAQ